MISSSLLSFFSRYISLDTSLPSGENYPLAIQLLEKMMRDYGFQTNIVPIPETVAKKSNRVNLIAHTRGKAELPTLLIYNHIDVVPAPYPDAFTLKMEKGKLFGRGAADMKGCTLALLSAFEQLKGKRLAYNLIVIYTTDEETDQLAQLRYLHPKLALPKETVVIDPDTFAGGISVAHLGQLGLTVTVRGKSVHSGMSHLGKNAIEDASKLIVFLQTLKSEYEHTFSNFTAPKSADMGHPCSRLNVNMISGGTALNVVPDVCEISVDCRYIPEADVDKEKEKLLQRIHTFCAAKQIEIAVTQGSLIEGYATEHPLTDTLSKIYRQVSGETDVFCVLGSTPLSHWCKENQLPHIGLGVIRADNNIHGIGEFVYQKDVEEVAETYRQFLCG